MHTCSSSLFYPNGQALKRCLPMHDALHMPELTEADCYSAISAFLGQKNYPCAPALHSFKRGDYLVGLYPDEFGSAQSSLALFRDLLFFREKQKSSGSPYMTFWAIFDGYCDFSEEEFERRFWREISAASSHQDAKASWDIRFSADPEDMKFCPSFGGEAFFIVGMHANSSRKARRFPYPAMVFNLYEQFDALAERGQYEAIVKLNRGRELQFQGDLNPMVLEHGEKWESIQFSGKKNQGSWKCPFKHFREAASL
jgi:FPC/CPF motif-containing protein YcgG